MTFPGSVPWVPPRLRGHHDADMRNLIDLAAERGGLIPTYRLRGSGLSPRQIAALRHGGQITRVRQGWYVLPGCPPPVVAAARVGGQLTCHGALALHGVWAVRDARLHVAVNQDATQLRTPHDPSLRRELGDARLRVHWRRSRDESATALSVASVDAALSDYARCAPNEHLAAAVDSALHLGLLKVTHPLAVGFLAKGIDGICESGIETFFWLRIQRLRIAVVRQVWFRGLGRVDFLIGERLVVEVDGQEFHDRESSFERDRKRDAALSTLGYRVLRFSYSQVMTSWPLVEAAVLAAISRGDHLR